VWVRSQLNERLGGGTEQDIVEVLLMLTEDLTQLLRDGEDHVKVGDRQELLSPLRAPHLGGLLMTFRATAVAARVVDVVFLTTMIALQELPA
jgi:hypothetical protein